MDPLVAVVTGAASGIGLATTRTLLDRGVRVLAVDVDVARLHSSTAVLREGGAGESLAHVVADASTSDGAKDVVAGAVDRWGGIDLLHLNAGRPGVGPLTDGTDLAEASSALTSNVMAVIAPFAHALAPLQKSPQAAVSITSSLAGVVGSPADPVYSASKHALVGLVRSLAPVHPRIRINAVCPSLVRTAMIGAHLPDELPVLDPLAVAEVVAAQLLESTCTGQVVVLEHGRPPVDVPEPQVSVLQGDG